MHRCRHKVGKVLDLIKGMLKPSEARASEKSNVYTKERLRLTVGFKLGK